MGWKKLTVIVVSAAALLGGAMALSMHLTRQQEIAMEVPQQPATDAADTEVVEPPKVGDTTTLTDMENMPIYYNDEDLLLLPVRNVVESLGGSVKWDAEKQATEINLRGKKLLVYRGSADAELNGYQITLDRAVESINGCLYVSADIFSDYFASDVIWDSAQRIVTVKTGDNTNPILANYHLEGQEGDRMYQANIPVIVGLNDISYEKRLNEDLMTFAMEQLASFPSLQETEQQEVEQQEAQQTAETTMAEETQPEAATAETQTEVPAEQTQQTQEPEGMTEQEPAPAYVRLRYEPGYCDSNFISLYWEVDAGGVLSAKSVNIDLQEQKYVTLDDLTAVTDLEQQLQIFTDQVDKDNYYVTANREWVLLVNQAEEGAYQTVVVTNDTAKRVWKEKYAFLITAQESS